MASMALGEYQCYTQRKHKITNKSLMEPVKAKQWYSHDKTTDPNNCMYVVFKDKICHGKCLRTRG